VGLLWPPRRHGYFYGANRRANQSRPSPSGCRPTLRSSSPIARPWHRNESRGAPRRPFGLTGPPPSRRALSSSAKAFGGCPVLKSWISSWCAHRGPHVPRRASRGRGSAGASSSSGPAAVAANPHPLRRDDLLRHRARDLVSLRESDAFFSFLVFYSLLSRRVSF